MKRELLQNQPVLKFIATVDFYFKIKVFGDTYHRYNNEKITLQAHFLSSSENKKLKPPTYQKKAPESSVYLKQLAESQPGKCKTKCKQ